MSSIRVGGFTPLTTVDYPGELAAVVFCQGCPWRCRYCHNGHLLPARSAEQLPWEEVVAFLKRRLGLLDAVVFSGGEPTAQHALADALTEVRALGFRIGLHTAGCYPQRLERLLPLLDWVGLDIKGSPEDYPEITGVPDSGLQAWRSLDLLLRSGIEFEVRTTVPPTWPPERVRMLAESLAEAGVKNFVLQTCNTGRALDADWRRMPAATQTRLAAEFTGLSVRGG